MFDIWSYKFTATNIYVSNLWTIAFLGKSEIVVQKGNSDPGTNGNTASNPNNYWKIRKKATVMNQKWLIWSNQINWKVNQQWISPGSVYV